MVALQQHPVGGEHVVAAGRAIIVLPGETGVTGVTTGVMATFGWY